MFYNAAVIWNQILFSLNDIQVYGWQSSSLYCEWGFFLTSSVQSFPSRDMGT